MTQEQIKAKAEEDYPYESILDGNVEFERAAYLRCWEQNCLPMEKEIEELSADNEWLRYQNESIKGAVAENERLREVLNEILSGDGGKRFVSDWLSLKINKALSGEGNGGSKREIILYAKSNKF